MAENSVNPSSFTSSTEPKSIYLCFLDPEQDEPNMWRKIDISMKEDTTTFISHMPEMATHHNNSVALGSIIYALGRSSTEVYFLDTLRPDIGWKKAPSLLSPRDSLYLTPNAGNIYAVDSSYRNADSKKEPQVQEKDWGEVFNPLLGIWKPLLGPDCKTLADSEALVEEWEGSDGPWNPPSGKGFLLDSKDGLFMYDVDCNSLEAVKQIRSTTKWEGAIVGNNVVYYFNERVQAYDLRRGRFKEKWLKGLEAGRVSPYVMAHGDFWSPSVAFVVSVGDGRLCLLYESNMGIHCTRFRVSEYSDGDQDIEIFATIEAYRVYEHIEGYYLQQCLVL